MNHRRGCDDYVPVPRFLLELAKQAESDVARSLAEYVEDHDDELWVKLWVVIVGRAWVGCGFARLRDLRYFVDRVARSRNLQSAVSAASRAGASATEVIRMIEAFKEEENHGG